MNRLSYVKFSPSANIYTHDDRHGRDRFAVIDGVDNHGILWEAYEDVDSNVIEVHATGRGNLAGTKVITRVPFARCESWRPVEVVQVPAKRSEDLPKPAAPASKK